jgi:hypothetical protein
MIGDDDQGCVIELQRRAVPIADAVPVTFGNEYMDITRYRSRVCRPGDQSRASFDMTVSQGSGHARPRNIDMRRAHYMLGHSAVLTCESGFIPLGLVSRIAIHRSSSAPFHRPDESDEQE